MRSLLVSALIASASPALAQDAPMPALDEARVEIEALDARLFHAAFEGCDPAALKGLIASEFRMLHDLAGLAVPNGAQFVERMEEQCAARGPGGANEGYKNRRLLVPGSRSITALGNWGMLDRGWHTFHEWRGEERGWVQTGGARFIHVWRWMPAEGQFRLAESISVDHGSMPGE